MTRSLLDLPPELIVHTLSYLPIPALLRFGQTCRHSQSLANSSLHTLSLGIYTSRTSGAISKLVATQYPQPKTAKSVFALPEPTSSRPWLSTTNSVPSSRRSSLDSDILSDDGYDDDPHRVSVLIPDAQSFGRKYSPCTTIIDFVE
jgi:hypothetical protein